MMNSRKQLGADSSDNEELEIVESNEDSHSMGAEENQGATACHSAITTLSDKTVRLNKEESDLDVRDGEETVEDKNSKDEKSPIVKNIAKVICTTPYFQMSRKPELSCNPRTSKMSDGRLSLSLCSSSFITTPLNELTQNRRSEKSTLNLAKIITLGERTPAPLARSRNVANKNAEYERLAENNEEFILEKTFIYTTMYGKT